MRTLFTLCIHGPPTLLLWWPPTLDPFHNSRPPASLFNHLGHVFEDALDLQDLVEIRLYPVAPVHHLVAVAGDLEALARLAETNHGNICQPHLRFKQPRDQTRLDNTNGIKHTAVGMGNQYLHLCEGHQWFSETLLGPAARQPVTKLLANGKAAGKMWTTSDLQRPRAGADTPPLHYLNNYRNSGM